MDDKKDTIGNEDTGSSTVTNSLINSVKGEVIQDKILASSEDLGAGPESSNIPTPSNVVTGGVTNTAEIMATKSNNIPSLSEIRTNSGTAPTSAAAGIQNSESVFKVPKKIVPGEIKIPDSNKSRQLQSDYEAGNENGSGIKLNKNAITNLNKSLKAKQKIINTKEPHPKNSTIISEILNTSPSAAAFPNNISNENELESLPTVTGTGTANPVASSTASISDHGVNSKTTTAKEKKRLANQNSTRTDFFAAKLASAVDDVESSDSDETFVYETNVPSYENNTISNGMQAGPNGHLANSNNVNTVLSSPRTENVSRNGSVMNAPGIVNNIHSPPQVILGDPSMQDTPISASKTDSIQSLRSIKFPKTATSVGNGQVPKLSNSHTEPSNKDITTISGKERPPTQRSNSIYSVVHPTLRGTDDVNKLQYPIQFHDQDTNLQHSPTSSAFMDTLHSVNSVSTTHYPNDIPPNVSGPGLGLFDTRSSYQPSNTAVTSINDGYTNDDRYSSEDVDEDAEVIDDANSTEGDFYGTDSNGIATANSTLNGGNIALEDTQATIANTNNTNTNTNNTNNNNLNGAATFGEKIASTNSMTSKGKKNTKSTTTSSSKLRSTTSKLFDKKGSQPRRYSIIPDDIDIEDFDDELIYYDNNVRFPYNNNHSIGTNQYSENSPLMNQGGRIPHYRSLNLNPPNGKRLSQQKGKRYLSSGPGLPHQASNIGSPVNEGNSPHPNNDIFPFPYPDPNQPYYYDFDEFDEASHSDSLEHNHLHTLGRKSARNISAYGHPHLSATNGHFILPRKKSSLEGAKVNCIKSFIYTLISILTVLSVGFIMGFVLATTKELTHVNITTINNALVSQDELVFNIIVEAYNPGWFSVDVSEVELDIFAKSGYLPDEGSDVINDFVVETVLLGSVYSLESPMTFRGGFFNREPLKQHAEMKLITPGKNLSTVALLRTSNTTDPSPPDNSKKWEIISKNPFDIIVRGILKYKLPMTSNSKSVVVKKTAYVDPTGPV
ncbi:hypothetical protein CAAN1_11S02894 [[Candida] anglica]|uniref:Vacuolar segregation protein 7 n=1 Tax=[Candida] anglica TaxID=148631 RepID=A0ABP0EI03_9ASCO